MPFCATGEGTLLLNMRLSAQDEDKDFKDAEVSARRAVRLMEAAFGKDNPRNSTAYGTLAAILK